MRAAQAERDGKAHLLRVATDHVGVAVDPFGRDLCVEVGVNEDVEDTCANKVKRLGQPAISGRQKLAGRNAHFSSTTGRNVTLETI